LEFVQYLLGFVLNHYIRNMQFIDFKKEHFSQNEEDGRYFIQISKDEVGYEGVEVLEKQEDQTFIKADCEILDEVHRVTIKMKDPQDIRVKF